SYLWGESRERGWWYYYVAAFLMKTPVGVISLFSLATIAIVGPVLIGRRVRRCSSAEWAILVSIGAIYAAGAIQSELSAHFRYMLPAEPLILLVASRCFAMPKNALIRSLAGGLMVFGVTSSLFTFPHSMAYFNEIVGGPGRAWRLLARSNLDWGQDWYRVADWLNSH